MGSPYAKDISAPRRKSPNMAKQWQETLAEDLAFDEKKHTYFYKGEYVPGVTTVISTQVPKPALVWWAAGVATEHLGWFDNRKVADREVAMAALVKRKQEINVLDAEGYLAELGVARMAHSRIKQEAAGIGHAAHKWIETHIKCRLVPDIEYPDIPEDPRVLNAVNAFLDWEKGKGVIYIASEKKLYSRRWRVAGTADVLAKIDGVWTLIDIKTSNSMWDEHFIQVAAYAAMLEETGAVRKIGGISIVHLGKSDAQFAVYEVPPDARELYEEKFDLCARGWYLDQRIKDGKKAPGGEMQK